MSALDRTDSGYRNYDAFYEGKVLVWVEGDEDVPFWRVVFPSDWQGNVIHFKPAGGSKILEVAERIAQGETKAIAAMDSDYDDILRNKPTHHLIVKTTRYSIENYLYVPEVIDIFLTLKCRVNAGDIALGDDWEKEVCESVEELLYLDCAAQASGTNVKVLGDNCSRFLKRNSWRFSKTRIKTRAGQLAAAYPALPDLAEKVRARFERRRILHYIRGPFLTHSIWRLLRYARRVSRRPSSSIRLDDIFDTCLLIFSEDKCASRARSVLVRRVRRALKAYDPLN